MPLREYNQALREFDNPVILKIANPPVMRSRSLPSTTQARNVVVPNRSSVPSQIIRTTSISKDGLIRIPVNDATPDAHQIVRIVHNLSVEFGNHPKVREFVTGTVLCNVSDNDLDRIARQISSFVRHNIKYLPDPYGAEFLVSPLVYIAMMTDNRQSFGDCDDHVLFLNSLWRSVGLETRVVGVKINATDRFDHVISAVRIGSRWYETDPCSKSGATPIYRERVYS